jgi:Cu(I)/Ag(I) efflux system membrane fusion protein
VPGLVPVELAFDRVQLIGMRKARATIESIASEVRTVGFVTADESRLARVHARFSGWIDSLDVSTTGVRVTKGEVLARVYNVELLPAQQEFLAARGWKLPASGTAGGLSEMSSALATDARLRLELLGMSPREIERIAETGAPSRTLEVEAPRSGHIIRKDVVQGSYIQPGTELFEIADLSRVWVLADVYEDQLARIRVGQTVRVDFDAYPGVSASGKLAFTYPTLSSETRTLRVRIVLANPDMKLRPGMYANVVVQIEPQRGLLIPREALVDTGDEQYVFVAREGGRFEPRRVRTGSRSGDKVEIVRGLREGEEVVTTGNFLIDSESRLRAAVTGAD